MTAVIDVEYRVIEPPSERGWWWGALALAAAWLVYATPWLFQGYVIPWDAKDYYYPVLRFLAASLAQGEPGQWNPYLYSGFPAIADPQSWYFTLTMRLFAALVPAPSMTVMDGVELFHLLIGAIGLMLFLRRVGLRPVAGTIAGLVFMFGGVAASRLQHSLMIVSYAYLPWALLLLTIACDSPKRSMRLLAAVAFGLVAGCMAADRDQVAFLNCLFLIAMAAWQIARRLWPQPKLAAWTALELTPALIGGALVLAMPMILTLDLLAVSTRPEIDYTIAAHASLQPASFLTLLHPDFYSSLQSGAYWGPGRLPWMSLSATGYDWTDEAVSHFYIGIVPLVLLAVGMAIRVPPNSYRRFFVAALLVTTIYAVGAYTPIFRVIYDWVPGVDLFRRPNDAAFLINTCLAVLVGFACQAVLTVEEGSGRVSKLLVALIVLLLLAAGVGALWIGAYFDHAPEAARALVIALPLFLVMLIFILLGRRKLSFRVFAGALVVLSGADLIWHHSGATFSAHPAETIKAYQPAGAALANEIRGRLGGGTNRGRIELFGLGGSWQNAAMVYQLEQTLGYNPVRLADYERLSGSLQNNHLPERKVTEQFTGYDSALAQQLGIRIIITGAPLETILPGDHRSLTFLGPHGEAYVYQNKATLPRAVVAPRSDKENEQHAAGDAITAEVTAGETIGKAEIVAYRQSEVILWARLDSPGYVILHDIYHPAWTATVDGLPVPVLRANTLFRAVALPAGEHNVRFSFEPLSLNALSGAVRRITQSRKSD